MEKAEAEARLRREQDLQRYEDEKD